MAMKWVVVLATAALAGAANAQVYIPPPTPQQQAADPVPVPGSIVVTAAMPFGFAIGGNAPFMIDVVGFELGIGTNVTQDWYVGGTASIAFALDATGEWTNVPSLRLRLGAEARHVFHRGSAQASTDDGATWVGIPRSDWWGVRAGAETLDELKDVGAYGQLELGTSMWLNHVAVMLYGFAGIDIEPAKVYGASPATFDDMGNMIAGGVGSGTTAGAYLGIGWGFSFD